MKNSKWTIVLGVIAFLALVSMVWASPPPDVPLVPPQASPGFDADMVDGHHAGASGGAVSQRKNRVLWAGSNGKFSVKALPITQLNRRYLERKPDSSLYFPGNAAELHMDSVGDAALLRYGRGSIAVRKTGSAGEVKLLIPISGLPGNQSGDWVRVVDIWVYYKTNNASSYIDVTHLYKLNASNGGYYDLINSGTNRTSTSWQRYNLVCAAAQCQLSWPTVGFLTLELDLHFAGTGSGHDITIGGVLVGISYD